MGLRLFGCLTISVCHILCLTQQFIFDSLDSSSSKAVWLIAWLFRIKCCCCFWHESAARKDCYLWPKQERNVLNSFQTRMELVMFHKCSAKFAKGRIENGHRKGRKTHKIEGNVFHNHTLFTSVYSVFIGWPVEFLIGNSDRIEMSKFQRIQMPKAGSKMCVCFFSTWPLLKVTNQSRHQAAKSNKTHRWLELFQMNFEFALKFWQISIETFAMSLKSEMCGGFFSLSLLEIASKRWLKNENEHKQEQKVWIRMKTARTQNSTTEKQCSMKCFGVDEHRLSERGSERVRGREGEMEMSLCRSARMQCRISKIVENRSFNEFHE